MIGLGYVISYRPLHHRHSRGLAQFMPAFFLFMTFALYLYSRWNGISLSLPFVQAVESTLNELAFRLQHGDSVSSVIHTLF